MTRAQNLSRETDSLLPLTHPAYGETVQGVLSLERQVIEAPLEGLVLRYGLIYGPGGTGFDAPIAAGSVHVDAAAKAAKLAVTRGERGIYNVGEYRNYRGSAERQGHPSLWVGRQSGAVPNPESHLISVRDNLLHASQGRYMQTIKLKRF